MIGNALADTFIGLGAVGGLVGGLVYDRTPAIPAPLRVPERGARVAPPHHEHAGVVAPPRTTRLMFIGDSLAAGYHATTVDAGFSATLVRHLEMFRGPVVRLGAQKAGGRCGQVLAVDDPADVVVVELGTNDALHTPLSVFVWRYARLLRMVRDTSPLARLVCVGVWRARWRAFPYDRIIRALGRHYEGEFVPLSDLYADAALRGPAGRQTEKGVSDDFHPNDAGHEAIAGRLAPHVYGA